MTSELTQSDEVELGSNHSEAEQLQKQPVVHGAVKEEHEKEEQETAQTGSEAEVFRPSSQVSSEQETNQLPDKLVWFDEDEEKHPASTEKNKAAEYDFLFKVVLLGNSGVGKSNLLLRLTRDTFEPELRPTVGVEFAARMLRTFKDERIKVQIWDTAGEERYKSITAVYYRGSVGALLCFDLCERDSFESIDEWFAELSANASANVQVVLVGTKQDCEEDRQISKEEAQQWAAQRGLPYIETSAKQASNVRASFELLCQRVYRKIALESTMLENGNSSASVLSNNASAMPKVGCHSALVGKMGGKCYK